MGYVGTAPLSGDYRKLDDISGSFNGSTTDFTLQVGSANVTPPKETTMLISVGGILQEPVSAYTVSGSTISFTSAPASGADFFGILLGDTMAIGTPSDATITAAKVENTFISGQTEITSGLDAADELLYSDGGTIKKVGLDTLADKLAGTNITASAGVLSGTADTNTTYTAASNGGIGLSGTAFSLDIDGMTDIGAGVASGDLLIIDDGAGGTNRKTTVDRIATLFAGTGLTASSGVITVDAASTTAAGKVELATSAEINTSTDAARVMTPDLFAASNYGIRYVQIMAVAKATDLTVTDGLAYFHVPAGLNGMDLVEVHAEVFTAPAGSTATFEISKNGASTQMLSTNITIDASETGSDSAATAAVIDTSNDNIATNDLIQINCTQVGSSTAGAGLLVTMGFRIP